MALGSATPKACRGRGQVRGGQGLWRAGSGGGRGERYLWVRTWLREVGCSRACLHAAGRAAMRVCRRALPLPPQPPRGRQSTDLGMTPGGQRLPHFYSHAEARPMPVLPQSHPAQLQRHRERPPAKRGTRTRSHPRSGCLCQGPAYSAPRPTRGLSSTCAPAGGALPVPKQSRLTSGSGRWSSGRPRAWVGLGEEEVVSGRTGPGSRTELSPPLHRRPQCWGGRDLPLPPAPTSPWAPRGAGREAAPGVAPPGARVSASVST